MIPGTALIATVYQEGVGIGRWLEALAAQTCAPEEFIVVDGASADDTVLQITTFPWPKGFPTPRVIVERCNIAAGRNIAIRNTGQPMIISTDAGSLPEPTWLEKIAAPMIHDPGVAVVAGETTFLLRDDFRKRLAPYLGSPPATSETVMPSSRCIAFRREAWAAVGGYPEWLTLTAEDTLFNYNLRAAGFRFHYEPDAIVHWEVRATLEAFLRMIYGYGYGWAEARLWPAQYIPWLVTVLFPPALLFSRNALRDIPFRFRRNFAGASGWVMGVLFGRRPPKGWKMRDGVLLSPETVRFLREKSRNG